MNERLMNRPRGIILDLDGTLYSGGHAIPGAVDAIAALRRGSHPVVFVTNALESPADYAAKLTQLGVPACPDQVITAPLVLTRYLGRHMPDATLFVISDPPLPETLSKCFRLSEEPDEIDAVVVSCDQSFDAHKLNVGFQALRQGARFLAVNADATCPVPGGVLPDAGAVIGALEGCTGRKVEVVAGKPSDLMANSILGMVRRPAGECLMVGDSLETDILMGHRNGMTTALVLTGVTRREDLGQAAVQPDYVLESLAELPWLLDKTSEPQELGHQEAPTPLF
jgi:NagD protein